MYPNPNNGNQQQQPPLGFAAPGAVPNCPYPPQGGTGGYPPPYPTGQAPYPGYPPAGPGYPQAGPGYPPASGAGYPPASGAGYPPAGPGYPQAGYPQATSAPYGQPSYAPSPVYPSQPQFTQAAPAYPGAYPGAQQAAYPGAAQTAYPQQQATAYQTAAPLGAHQAAPAAMSQQYQDVPTICDGPCDPSQDAQVLRKAMKGMGTDEKAIINVLAKRTDRQRQQISQAFKASFGKDLIKDLKSELGGKLEDVVLAMMTPRIDYLAQVVYKSISGIGTKESILVDVLCTASNQEIHMINASYQRQYGRPLEKDIRGDTSGHFERLLVSICTGGRDENPVANPQMASEDAQKLLNAGEKKWGTDESTFNMILATRSYAQLRLMFHEYERLTGHGFEKAIKQEFSGDVERGMLAIVKCAKNRAAYFAERLHNSIAGMGTKDNDLIFIIVTRAEIDLGSVGTEYNKMYHKSLASAVSGDTSGDYKKVLLALMGN